MIWTAPTRGGSVCAKLDGSTRSNFREEQSDEDYDHWHRSGKAILQRSRGRRTWQGHGAQELEPDQAAGVHGAARALPGRDGSVQRGARYGAPAAVDGAPGATDGGE